MKTSSLIALAGAWFALTALGQAQMSTFPTPPTLAPPTDHASDDPAKNPGSTTPGSDGTDSLDTAEQKILEQAKSSGNNSAPASSPTPVTAATLSSMTALDDKVALEAGDTISFRVIEDRDDAVSRVVTDTGEVDFPYIGRVKVEGKTCHEVALEVKKLLEVDYYKQATVIVGLDLIIGEDKTKPHDMAWVVGEVRDVGPLELLKAQPITVSQAIMRAGGFGDFADQRKVKLIHRSAESTGASGAPVNLSNAKDFQVVDVKSVFEGKSTADPVIKPGDYIIVPKQFVNF
jgi:protein involved in polysaccharide export with SLBB domain